jgi:hypothetical protein
MKRLLLSLLAVSALGLVDGQTQLSTEGTDLRLNVTNALIKTLQNSRQFSLNLKWDFLPDASHVAKMKALYDMAWPGAKNTLWGEWTIPNKLLKTDGGWQKAIHGMKTEDRKFLGAVINAGTPIDLEGQNVESLFIRSIGTLSGETTQMTGWTQIGQWPQDVNVPGATPNFATTANYRFCLSMLHSLMGSRGMGLKIEEDTGKLRLNGSKFLSDQIVWTIRAYRSQFFGFKNPEGRANAIPQTFTLSIGASIRNIRFDMISAESVEADTVKLNLTAGLVSDVDVLTIDGKTLKIPAMIPWTVATGSTDVAGKKLPGVDDLKEETVSPSSTSLILDVIGGVDVGKTITDGLFGNNEDAHLVTGGLIGNGPTKRVIGVNMTRQNGPLGVLMGLVPDDSNALFIGPSLQAGIFTLGAGGRIFGRDDGSTSAKWAGVLSIDLSRALTRPAPPTSVAFTPTDSSSSFWGPFPVALENQLIASFAFKMSGDLPAGTLIRMSEANADGSKREGGKSFVIPWTPDGNIYWFKPLVPKGKYLLELPDNVGAKAVDQAGAENDMAKPIVTVTERTAIMRFHLFVK